MTAPVTSRRLDELAARYGLPAGADGRLAALLDLVAAEPAAITTVRDPAEGVDVHVADSLVALDLPAVRDGPPRRRSRLWRRVSGPGAGDRAARRARRAGRERRAQVRVPRRRGERARARATSRSSTRARRRGRRASAPTTSSSARALAPLPRARGVRGAAARAGRRRSWPGRAAASRPRRPTARAAAAALGHERARARSPVDAVRGARDRHLYLSSKVSPTPDALPAPAGNGPQTADPSLELKVMALRRRTNGARAPTGAAASLTADGHDLRDREPEGRRRQDDDRRQRRRLHRRGRLRDAARRHRPAGQRDGRARARRRTASRASTTSSCGAATAEEALVADRRSTNLTVLPSHPDLAARQRRAPARAGLRAAPARGARARCATASPTRCSTARRRSAR